MLTFGIVSVLGLPGWDVRAPDAAVNLTMWQEFLGFPHVDVVYWTLQQELYFYTLMFALYCLGGLARVRVGIAGLLILGTAASLARWGPEGTAGRKAWEFLMIGGYFYLFAIGILLYRLRSRLDAADLALVVGCLGYSALTSGLAPTAAIAFLASLIYAAVTDRLRFLATPVLLFLGTISYTLYLVHESIGYAIIRRMIGAGWNVNGAILATTTIVVALATAVTFLVEKPALRWLSPKRPPTAKEETPPALASVAEPGRADG